MDRYTCQLTETFCHIKDNTQFETCGHYYKSSGTFISNLIPPVLRKYNFCSQQVTNKKQRILIHIILSG